MLFTREMTFGEQRDLRDRLHALLGSSNRPEAAQEKQDIEAIVFVAVPGKNPDLEHDLREISESNLSPAEKAEQRRQVLAIARENSMAALSIWNNLRYRESWLNNKKVLFGKQWESLLNIAWKHTKSADEFERAFEGMHGQK